MHYLCSDLRRTPGDALDLLSPISVTAKAIVSAAGDPLATGEIIDCPTRSGPLTTLEKVNIAVAMTWAAGFVDLVGYVSLYGLYTSHMTGNTVAMARHISALQWSGVVRRGWPILTFVFGLMLGAFIYEAERRRQIQIPFPPAIGLEALLIAIFIAAGIGSGFKADIPPQPAGKFFVMVALLAIPMGIQNVVIRKVGGLNVYTTFVTGSLVKFA